MPAPAAVAVIGGLIGVSWLAAYYLGGGTNVAPHWFYIPIFLAGLRFGPFGALLAGAYRRGSRDRCCPPTPPPVRPRR
jgi:hypothetical protein